MFKLSPNIPAFVANQTRRLNLIPFSATGGTIEMTLNVIVFIPMAMLLSLAVIIGALMVSQVGVFGVRIRF